MDINQLMQMASKVRDQLETAQAKAEQQRLSGEAGGGLVSVILNGAYEVVQVQIDPKCLDEKDIHLLEDLVRAALNQAIRKVSESHRGGLESVTQNLGIDLSALGLDKR